MARTKAIKQQWVGQRRKSRKMKKQAVKKQAVKKEPGPIADGSYWLDYVIRVEMRDGVQWVLVKYWGWGDEHNEWMPVENLGMAEYDGDE